MRIAIIGGSGFVGSRLISLLQTIPDSKLLNIDKQPSKLCPDITEIADVLDVRKLTERDGKNYVTGHTKEYLRIGVPCEPEQADRWTNQLKEIELTSLSQIMH